MSASASASRPGEIRCAGCGVLVGQDHAPLGDVVLVAGAEKVLERCRILGQALIRVAYGHRKTVAFRQHPVVCSPRCHQIVLVDPGWAEYPQDLRFYEEEIWARGDEYGARREGRSA